MKVFVVFKGYWMYQTQIYKVFFDKNKAADCVKKLMKKPDVRAYFNVFEIEDSCDCELVWKNAKEFFE